MIIAADKGPGKRRIEVRAADASSSAHILTPLPDDEIPSEFRIWRAGLNRTTKGDFLFDAESARLVLEGWMAMGNGPIAMDYEHAAAVGPDAGAEGAPSPGWFEPEVRWSDAGPELWAVNVRWTPKAADYLRNREYRQFSPWFEVDPETGRIVRLRNIALTNVPATRNQPALVAVSERTTMDPEKLAAIKAALAACSAALEGGDEEAVKTAITSAYSAAGCMPGEKTSVSASDRVLLGEARHARQELAALTGRTEIAAQIGVIRAWKETSAEVVQLRDVAAKSEAESVKLGFQSAIEGGKKAGKLPPALIDGWVEKELRPKGRAGLVTLTAFLESAPAVVASGKVIQPKAPEAGERAAVTLTDTDKRVAELLGHDPKAVAKHKRTMVLASEGAEPDDDEDEDQDDDEGAA